jgi:hypothetical protein
MHADPGVSQCARERPRPSPEADLTLALLGSVVTSIGLAELLRRS